MIYIKIPLILQKCLKLRKLLQFPVGSFMCETMKWLMGFLCLLWSHLRHIAQMTWWTVSWQYVDSGKSQHAGLSPSHCAQPPSPWRGSLNPLPDWKSRKSLLLPQAPQNQVIKGWFLTLGVIKERALSKCSNFMCLVCPFTYREVFLNLKCFLADWCLEWQPVATRCASCGLILTHAGDSKGGRHLPPSLEA